MRGPAAIILNPRSGGADARHVLAPFLWVAVELARTRITGFPWELLGTAQVGNIPLARLATYTGVYGISFLVVWTSLSFFSAGKMILKKPASRFAWQSEIILPLLAVAAIFVFGDPEVIAGGVHVGAFDVVDVQAGVVFGEFSAQ